MITVEARPKSVSIDPERAAVLVVDMQNDFGAVGGMFHRAGIDIWLGLERECGRRLAGPVRGDARAAALVGALPT